MKKVLPFATLSCLLGVVLLAINLLAQNLAVSDSSFEGVFVERTIKGSAGEKAGLQKGDRLLSWAQGARGGLIDSSFKLDELEIEHGPLGAVRIEGTRGTTAQTWVLGPEFWGVIGRPAFAPEVQIIFDAGDKQYKREQFKEAAEYWRRAAEKVPVSNPTWMAAWLLESAALAQERAHNWLACDDAYRTAVDHTAGLSTGVRVLLFQNWANTFWRRNDLAQAQKYYHQALAESRQLSGESLLTAKSLNALGSLAEGSQAEPYLRQALSIREKLAPESLVVAETFFRLSYIAGTNNDPSTAEAFARHALTIQQVRAPAGLEVASTLSALGTIANMRGDLEQSEKYNREALTILGNIAPDGADFAWTVGNLSTTVAKRGDLAQAEELLTQAIRIWGKLLPDGDEIAVALNNLGKIEERRGDLIQAEAHLRRSLEIVEKVAPGSLQVALRLTNLGMVARESGDLAQAETYLRQALTVQRKLAPESFDVAVTLQFLGKVAQTRGNLAQAEDYFRQSLHQKEKFSANSIEAGWTLSSLGIVLKDRGDLAAAETYLRRALTIEDKLAPASIERAESLHALGLVLRRTNRLAAAEELLSEALEVLERQTEKLGGTEERRSEFRSNFAAYYRDEMDLLVDQGQNSRAFHVLERSRARSMLAMLAERDLSFSSDLPLETQQARLRNAAQYDQVQAQVAHLNPEKQSSQIEPLQARLRELAAERAEIAENLRRKSPRLAALQYPQPIDLPTARRTLDDHTVLLSYSVGPQRTVLFVVAPGSADPGLQVLQLPIGEDALRRQVQEFRQLAEQRTSAASIALQSRAQVLYNLLLKPAEPQLSASKRILIVPDGPLHTLSFSALRRGSQYLVEWKPLHTSTSMTVYAELKKMRHSSPASGDSQMVAFGAPRYSPGANGSGATAGDVETRSMRNRGFAFSPLPFSREEVRNIKELFPGISQTFVDSEATEERAKAVGKQTRYLHFATHAVLDERIPLNSAVVLTIPETMQAGQDNGLLQAWEIFDQMRLDADLVVLSGCRTGLGREVSGEGLVGLTRAFQYAGARSVLASLWNVEDRRTTQLMRHFYDRLAKGDSKDQALQAAQLALLRTGASPFYWAGFALNGDWR